MGADEAVGAWERMTRVVAFALGAAGALFLLIANPSVPAQLGLAAWWWNATAFALIVAPVLVLAAGALTLPLRWVLTVAGALAVGHLVVVGLVPFGFREGAFAVDTGWPWAMGISAPCITAAALVWGRRGLAWYLPVFAGCWWVSSSWVLVGEDALRLARGGLGTAALGVIFALVAVGSQAGGAALDTQTRRLRAEAAARARAAAEASERARVDGLVHDHVLAALLATGRRADAGIVRAAADQALAALRSIATAPLPGAQLPAAEAAARLRQTCADLDEHAAVHLRCPDPAAPVTTAVTQALQEVLAEALRNSLRHAGNHGHPVTRTVDITISGGSATVVARDDGAGFDPATVPPRRLGIAVGMRARLDRLPGATLRIDTAPGSGTVVTATAPTAAAPVDTTPTATDDTGGHHTTAPDVVGLHTWGAAAVALVFLAADATRPFETIREGVLTPLYLATVTALAAGAVLLLRRSPDPMPQPTAWALVGCAAAAAVLNTAAAGALAVHAATALWAWNPATVLLSFLTVRGHFAAAWAGQGAMTAVYCLWYLHLDTPFTGSFVLTSLLWNLLLLVVCSLYSRTLRRQVGQANTTRDHTITLAADRAHAQARLRERDEQLTYLDTTARPLLEHLAHHPDPGPDERAHTLLIEARLRDRIRARALATEPVLDAAQTARARGVEVSLLDDGALDTAEPTLAAHVREAVRTHLATAHADRVTARVLPPGRTLLCTIAHTHGDNHDLTEIPAPDLATA